MEPLKYILPLGSLPAKCINEAFQQSIEAQCSFKLQDREAEQLTPSSFQQINLQIRGEYLIQIEDAVVVSSCKLDLNFQFQIIGSNKKLKQRKLKIICPLQQEELYQQCILVPLDGLNFRNFLTSLEKKTVIESISSLTKIFKQVKRLGSGQSGLVCEVKSLRSKETFAVKCQIKRIFKPKQFQILHSIQQKNIVHISKAYRTEKSVYLVMEKLELTLRQWQQNKGFPTISVKKLFHGILVGLQTIHSKGIAHRDIKPQNIMLRKIQEGYEPVLIDLNLSEDIRDKSNEGNFISGTFGFIAPEILKGFPEKDLKPADIFSLGATFYEILMWESLFKGKNQRQVQMANRQFKVDFQTPKFRSLSPSQQDLLKKMLTINPKDRITVLEALKHQVFKTTSQATNENFSFDL